MKLNSDRIIFVRVKESTYSNTLKHLKLSIKTETKEKTEIKLSKSMLTRIRYPNTTSVR